MSFHYTFSQIEAFVTVAEHGNLSKAAKLLGKDRTTIRDLLDYLEDALGYGLFLRQSRTLVLTEQGQQLQRQAKLLLRQGQAFQFYAQSLLANEQEEIVMVYDPFVPERLIALITARLSEKNVRFSAWCATREEAEIALKQGRAQLAICQAQNRAIGLAMEWYALGDIELDIYASPLLFSEAPLPLSLLALSLKPQVVMHHRHNLQLTELLQISGDTLYVNQCSVLRHLLENGQGWSFIPKHFQAQTWRNIQALETEIGNQGLQFTMVAIWQPGAAKQVTLAELIKILPGLWLTALK